MSSSHSSGHGPADKGKAQFCKETRRRVVLTSSASTSSSSTSSDQQPLVSSRVGKSIGIVIRDSPSRPEQASTDLLDLIPRPLTALNLPEIATDQVTSSFLPSDLGRIRSLYSIPQNFVLKIPGKAWRASRPPVGWICIYEDQLRGGLRFPLPPFFCAILREYQLPLAQIAPNGIRTIVMFLLLCGRHQIEPTVELFRFCFQCRKAAQALGYRTFHSRAHLKIITPDNNSGWRARYLFVKLSESGLPEEWNHTKFSDTQIKTTPPTGYERLESLPAQDGRRIGEHELVKYGLSPATLAPLQTPSTKSTKRVVNLAAAHAQKTKSKTPAATVPTGRQIVPASIVPPVAPSKSHKRKEVPDDTLAGAAKEPRLDLTTRPVVPALDASEAAPPSAESAIPLPYTSQLSGDMRSSALRVFSEFDNLMNLVGQAQTRADEAEKKLHSLQLHHKKQQELNRSLREASKNLQASLARQELETLEERKHAADSRLQVLGAQKQVAELKARLSQLEEAQLNQGDLCQEYTAKLFQTSDFGNWLIKLTDGSVSLGRNLVLRELMEACPDLKLKKSMFGWDPSFEARANLLQQSAQKDIPDFKLLQALKASPTPLSLEEVKALDVDYDVDLDKDWGTVADVSVCEDDEVPIFVPSLTSGAPPVPPSSAQEPLEKAS